jgi:hypothetical protein
VNKLLRDDESVITYEGFPRCHDTLLTDWSERQVCSSRMAPIDGPFCLAMADDEAARCRHRDCEYREHLKVG